MATLKIRLIIGTVDLIIVETWCERLHILPTYTLFQKKQIINNVSLNYALKMSTTKWKSDSRTKCITNQFPLKIS